MLLGVRVGGVCLLIPNPRDITGFVKELMKYQVNSFPAVNTLYNGLLHHPDFKKIDFSQLKISNGGGMAVQRPVAEQWKKLTGCSIAEGYGLSETSPTLTCNPATATEFNGSIGLPVPSTYLSIRDDDGNEVPLGQPGEICANGPQVMVGYWNRPDETAKVMTADGYFRTGDIGVMTPDGYTRIVDRKKDMILVSGFNVYPNEVEEVIASHPGVLECAVIGVQDERTGEAVKPFVVKKDPNLTAEDIIRFCHEQLTNYKIPKHDRIPDRTAENQCRKDPAPPVARRKEGRGGLNTSLPPSSRGRERRSKPGSVIPGWCVSTRPGISRFRVRCFASPRNDDSIKRW